MSRPPSMGASTGAPPQSAALVRGIRRWDLLALVINGTIGAGIFGLPSKVHALIGTQSLIAFAACAVVVAMIVLCFAEVGSRFEGTGGPYLYARAAFGSMAGFEVGWLLWLGRLTSFAALLNLFVTYLAGLWPGADSPPWRGLIITTVIAALTAVNVVGVRNAALFSNAFTIGKLVPLVLLIGVGIFAVAPGRMMLGPPPSVGSFSKAVLLLIYAFTGFEAVIIPTGEVRDPRRNLPWAMLTAIAVVAVIYELVQVVCIGVLPDLAVAERPLAEAGTRLIGAAGGVLITVGALISIMGTLNAVVLAAPRLPYAMAEQGELPKPFAATHPRFHTPWLAIMASSAVMWVLTISSTFLHALTISTIIRLLTYIATCAALPVLRRRPDAPPALFRAPLGPALAAATLLLCLWLIANSGWREARDAGIAAALGLPIYFAGRLRRRK